MEIDGIISLNNNFEERGSREDTRVMI